MTDTCDSQEMKEKEFELTGLHELKSIQSETTIWAGSMEEYHSLASFDFNLWKLQGNWVSFESLHLFCYFLALFWQLSCTFLAIICMGITVNNGTKTKKEVKKNLGTDDNATDFDDCWVAMVKKRSFFNPPLRCQHCVALLVYNPNPNIRHDS